MQPPAGAMIVAAASFEGGAQKTTTEGANIVSPLLSKKKQKLAAVGRAQSTAMGGGGGAAGEATVPAVPVNPQLDAVEKADSCRDSGQGSPDSHKDDDADPLKASDDVDADADPAAVPDAAAVGGGGGEAGPAEEPPAGGGGFGALDSLLGSWDLSHDEPAQAGPADAGPAIGGGAAMAMAGAPPMISETSALAAAQDRLAERQGLIEDRLGAARAQLSRQQVLTTLWLSARTSNPAELWHVPESSLQTAELATAARRLKARTAGLLHHRKRSRNGRAARHTAREVQRMVELSGQTVDPDATDASSANSSESESELDPTRPTPPQRDRKKRRRVQSIWDRDCAEVGWRWNWLDLRLRVVKQGIEEYSRLEEQVTLTKTPVQFGEEGTPAADSEAEAGPAQVTEADGEGESTQPPTSTIDTEMADTSAAELDAKFDADLDVNLNVDLEAVMADDECGGPAVDPTETCARARPLISFPRRHLVQDRVNVPPTSQIRPVSAPLVHSDRNAIRGRSALLDRGFHVVLSLPSDAPHSVIQKARAHRRMLRQQALQRQKQLQQAAREGRSAQSQKRSSSHQRQSQVAAARQVSAAAAAAAAKVQAAAKATAQAQTKAKSVAETPTPTISKVLDAPSPAPPKPKRTSRISVSVCPIPIKPEPVTPKMPKTPALSPTASGRAGESLLARRKRKENSVIDDVMMPVLAPARFEPLLVKEIPTPTWKRSAPSTPLSATPMSIDDAADSVFSASLASSAAATPEVAEEAVEDLSDATFVSRHEACETTERQRALGIVSATGQRSSVAGGEARQRDHSKGPMVKIIENRALSVQKHPPFDPRKFPLAGEDLTNVDAELEAPPEVWPQLSDLLDSRDAAESAVAMPDVLPPAPEPERKPPIKLLFRLRPKTDDDDP
mmetsp:Transcript_6629/g.17060  ORF Transcript_6629/g.17060 Transcript_6629/m.17060 type:complete len:903 (-) Transcript_6629:18-2726(-)